MTSMLLLLLIFVSLSSGERFLVPPPKPPRGEHGGKPPNEEPCHFPFRYQRQMHSSCLPGSFFNPRPWCATTENYDRDQEWKYCGPKEVLTGICDPNPCQHGGACEARRNEFHCICRPGFHGRHCEKESCFGVGRHPHLGKKETWLWHNQFTGVEECHCLGNKIVCKPMRGKACATNPCLNGGQCIDVKGNQVCACPKGFSGPLCDVDHQEMCYRGNGHLYRGTTQNSASGAHCVPWDSPFLHSEYSSQMFNATSLGLGAHPFCRNPDNDSQPWCYVLHNMQLTWEFCNIPRCQVQTAGDMVKVEVEEHSGTSQTSQNQTDGKNILTEAAVSAPVCGQRYTKITSSRKRVVGGMVALPGSHPYLAALYIGDQFCGGSLISSCWILTAAHCLEFRPALSKISVVLGQTIYNTSAEGSEILQVKNYHLHENYSPITKQHDIALVQLKEKTPKHCVEFSHSISPVCLPRSMKTTSGATSKQCQIAGWGHMYEGDDKLSLYLQEADMPIIPHEQCSSREVHGNRITQDMLCAGYLDGRADACQGDSGGPLVCEEQDGATLHGIISWGTGCAQENKPGVYTNVIHYLDWIQNNMN